VEVVGGIVYVVGDYSLELFDVSAPAAPAWLGGISTPHMAADVEVRNGLAFVADGWGTSIYAGVRVVDVSNPAAPVEIGAYPRGRPVALAVDAGVAYTVDRDHGLAVIEFGSEYDGVGGPQPVPSVGGAGLLFSGAVIGLIGIHGLRSRMARSILRTAYMTDG
jgi:hypothetical protein